MSMKEADLIAAAYVSLLRLPLASLRRHRLDRTLASLRDELALFEAKDAEHIQTRFEDVARLFEQQPLGPEFEKVLFDNIWELYAR